jgi:hypothetical protein
MKKFQYNAISFEIPKFCLIENFLLKFIWILRNNGNFEPKVQFFFKSKYNINSSINLKIFKTNTFLLKIENHYDTNVIKEAKIILKIKKVLRFNGFFDFDYYSSSVFKLGKNQNETIACKTIENCFYGPNKVSNELPVDLIPISFTRFRYLNHKSYITKKISKFEKKFQSVSDTILNQNYVNNPIGLDRRSIFSLESKKKKGLDFKTGLVPTFPPLNSQKYLRLIPPFTLGFLLRLYKHRPIWTKKSIEDYLPIPLRKYLKQALPIISYRFKGKNPFRETWLRFKFEPRKNSQSRIYQTIGFKKKLDKIDYQKKNKNKTKKFKNIKKREKITIKRKALSMDKTFFLNKQICDRTDSEYKEIIDKNCHTYINLRSGWLI